MQIGLDLSGNFSAGSGFESSAVAAATVPDRARTEIGVWTRARFEEWGREEIPELHASILTPDERRAVCEMLAARGDLHAAVIVTTSELLRGTEMVQGHRDRQLEIAEEAIKSAVTEAGRERGERAAKLLRGLRVARSRMNNASYVGAAMAPMAIIGAVQRAFCFYADDKWRPEMTTFELVFDEDRTAMMRYVEASLLPVLSDERFRLTTPRRWRESDPVHPLLVGAIHPDGDGYDSRALLGEKVAWVPSHAEPAVQVADVCAWVVSRAIAHPEDADAREYFEMLMPIFAGKVGACFELFSLGHDRGDDALFFSHLPRTQQPPEWLTPVAV
jgi:hypothetical protein